MNINMPSSVNVRCIYNRSLDAKPAVVEGEEKKLQELESILYKDFRRDIVEKIRNKSLRVNTLYVLAVHSTKYYICVLAT